MTLNTAGSDSKTAYDYTLSLNSPAFSVSNSSCLTLTYAPNANPFEVRLACIDSSGVYTEQLLYRILGKLSMYPDGTKLSNLSLNIDASLSAYKECSVLFKLTLALGGKAAVINAVELVTGRCLQPGKQRKQPVHIQAI